MLERNVEVSNTQLDFANATALNVYLELPENFIINAQVPTELVLLSSDESKTIRSPLKVGINSVTMGDVTAFSKLKGYAKIFYCEEAETSRCFLKKPKIELKNSPGLKSEQPLAIRVLPH